MKTILYMALTVNGKIAGADDDTSWTSKEDWQGFFAKAQEVGVIIIGRNTYEVIKKEQTLIPGIKLRIVVTHHQPKVMPSHTIFTDALPEKILTLIEEKGYDAALVAGGGQINSLFLKAGLIDELYIDIEPLILGRGISLFADGDFAPRLKLIEVKTLTNRQTIQLHYKIIK
ncbi:dihydrofolate reductase [Candidatus Gottesmanbacteria bacterium]|nr:dihydrofolate reductase [Candidatus Gottesmanbacteria bacterium]